VCLNFISYTWNFYKSTYLTPPSGANTSITVVHTILEFYEQRTITITVLHSYNYCLTRFINQRGAVPFSVLI
jgi:hypothetical protein